MIAEMSAEDAGEAKGDTSNTLDHQILLKHIARDILQDEFFNLNGMKPEFGAFQESLDRIVHNYKYDHNPNSLFGIQKEIPL